MQLSHEVCRAQDIPAACGYSFAKTARGAQERQRTDRGGFQLTKPINTVVGSDNQPKNANTAAPGGAGCIQYS